MTERFEQEQTMPERRWGDVGVSERGRGEEDQRAASTMEDRVRTAAATPTGEPYSVATFEGEDRSSMRVVLSSFAVEWMT